MNLCQNAWVNMLPALLTVVLKYQGQILVCVFGLPEYSDVIPLLPEKIQIILDFEQIEISKNYILDNFEEPVWMSCVQNKGKRWVLLKEYFESNNTNLLQVQPLFGRSIWKQEINLQNGFLQE